MNAGEATVRVGRMARICASTGAGSIAPGALRSASGMTLVTPEARFASRKIGKYTQVGFPGRELEALDERPVLRDQEPVGGTAALGSPVDPLVKVMIAGVPGSQG